MTKNQKVALITGAARRIGANIARGMHHAGYNVIIHYNQSVNEAKQLEQDLNQQRDNSALAIQADLNDLTAIKALVHSSEKQWNGLDVLINNASQFFPSPILESDEQQWDRLMNSNVKGPFFLSQAAIAHLSQSRGCIINITDIHADKPLKAYPIYSIAKAALAMLTKTLAKECAPNIRVNSIAPGSMIWPEADNTLTEAQQQSILDRTPMAKHGGPDHITQAVLYLCQAQYSTGTTITVDGGRSLSM